VTVPNELTNEAPNAVPLGVHHEVAADSNAEHLPVAGVGADADANDASAAAEENTVASEEPAAPAQREPPALPPVVNVVGLDWTALRRSIDPQDVRARMRDTVERMEALLDRDGGPGFLFDEFRADANDRAIQVRELGEQRPLWIIGDLHGDLLTLEAALMYTNGSRVFLGDLFDDGGFGIETLLRVYETMLEDPASVTIIAGNHDEALGFDGARFTATVSPSDFSETLNENLAHEWIVRAGKVAVRLFANAPRALFFPDGLLVSHGGFPLADLHAELEARGDWNDPRCMTDFVWARAHPKARKKMPNRSTRGSQFGYEDFAAFCDVATRTGRPVTHMVRGHDHVDERWAVFPAYAAHPILTTVALSRRLERESFGPYERVPTIARWVKGALPEVHRLHIPAGLIRDCFPPDVEETSTR
jgi:hypothetical protein